MFWSKLASCITPRLSYLIGTGVLCLIGACESANSSQRAASVAIIPSSGVITWEHTSDDPIPNLLPDTVTPIPEAELPQVVQFIQSLDSLYQWDSDRLYNCCEQRAFLIRNALAARGWNSWVLMNAPKNYQIEVTIPTRTKWYHKQIEWGHHTVPIARIQKQDGTIEELVFDVHFGTLPQSVEDWLSFQNLTETTFYAHDGQYYCTMSIMLTGACRIPSSRAGSVYFDCIKSVFIRPNNKLQMIGTWNAEMRYVEGSDSSTLIVDDEGIMSLYQNSSLMLQGPLLYHTKELKLNWQTTTVATTIPEDWGVEPNDTVVIDARVQNKNTTLALKLYLNNKAPIERKFDRIK